ncbi:hypothetical protein [Spirosoma litoris]
MTTLNMDKASMVELDFNEMQMIDGGNWLDDAGTWAGETWCRVKQAFSSGFSNGAAAADATR